MGLAKWALEETIDGVHSPYAGDDTGAQDSKDSQSALQPSRAPEGGWVGGLCTEFTRLSPIGV